MRNFDCLSRETPLRGHFFLEASAGTGKTFTIEHVINQLVLTEIDDTPPLTIDEILVVTFTKAATRDLKKRIRQALQTALKQMKEQSDQSPDYLKAIYEKGEPWITRATLRLERALCSLEKAEIYTIHSFSAKMLQRFAFEAKVPFSLLAETSELEISLIERDTLDTMRTLKPYEEFSPGQIASLLKKHNSNIHDISKAILPFLISAEEMGTFPSFHMLYQKFLAIMKKHAKAIEKLREGFSEIAPLYKGFCNRDKVVHPTFLNQLSALNQLISEKVFDSLATNKQSLFSLLKRSNLKKNAKIAEEEIDSFDQLSISMETLLQQVLDPTLNLIRLSKTCLERQEGKKHILSPDVFLQMMGACLNNHGFFSKVRKLFKAVIVDEFQDTDPIQWKIFHKLFAQGVGTEQKFTTRGERGKIKSRSTDKGHGQVAMSNEEIVFDEAAAKQRNKFSFNTEVQDPIAFFALVGDPKQSIYAFRNADLKTFVRAKDYFGEDHLYLLSRNFRSHPLLIKALNTLFSQKVAPNWLTLDGKDQSVEYIPILANEHYGQEAIQDTKASLHFLIGSSEMGRSKRWPTEKLEQQTLFPAIVREILSLKRTGLRFEQMAVLIKDRYQANRLIQFLRKHQIPAMANSSGHLAKSPLFTFLYDFLRSIESPSNMGKLKKLLSNSIFPWEVEEVSVSLDDTPLQFAMSQLKQLQMIYQERGIARCLEQLLETVFFPDRESFAYYLLESVYLDHYNDFTQLSEVLISEEENHSASLRELILLLESFYSLDPEEEPRLKRRTLHEGDHVHIMTTHMSKGLEFDVVFALGLLSRHGLAGSLIKRREDEKTKWIKLDTDCPQCHKALLEKDQEKMRLLYVAFTRAKRRLYVPFLTPNDQKNLLLGHASPLELLLERIYAEDHSWEQGYKEITTLTLNQVEEKIRKLCQERVDVSYQILEESISIDHAPLQEELPSLEVPKNPIITESVCTIQSFSSLKKGASYEKSEYTINESTLPIGVNTGLLFHAIFEEITLLSAYFPWQEEKINRVIDKLTTRYGLQNWKDTVYQWVKLAFHVPLEGFCLAEIPPSALLQEMEFLYRYQQDTSYLKGVADLIFYHQDRYYLLDWKLNMLENYDVKHLSEEMKRRHYDQQAAIYTNALVYLSEMYDDTRSFEEKFGGAFYIFVRGLERDQGIYHFMPNRNKEIAVRT